MSSGNTYAESVASCRALTPLSSPPPAVATAVPDALRLPVRRQLDFSGDGGNLDDDEDFLFRAAEEMERSLYEAKHRPAGGLMPPPPVAVAPPTFPEKQCICGRGPCDVEWKEPGRWAYVCSAPPQCKHSAWCEESDHNPNSEPVFWSHPEPNNPRVFNTRSNHRAGSTTRVNVSPQGAGATIPANVSPHGAGATIPANVSPQGAGATIPANVSPQGVGATTPVNVTPQGARSNGEWPICMCTAGKCKKSKVKGVEYYVCHIPQGRGACSHRELVNATAEEPRQAANNNPTDSKHLEYNPVQKEANGHNFVMMGGNNENRPVNPDQPKYDEWPFDIVDDDIVPTCHLAPAHATPLVAQGSPSMLHRPIALVELETPRKSPMPPKCTISPTTPRSGGCFRCHEEGHWAVHCPKKDACFHCGVVGHWAINCPKKGP